MSHNPFVSMASHTRTPPFTAGSLTTCPLTTSPLIKNRLTKHPLTEHQPPEQSRTDTDVSQADSDLFSALFQSMPMLSGAEENAAQHEFPPILPHLEQRGAENPDTESRNPSSQRPSSPYMSSLLSSPVDDTVVFEAPIVFETSAVFEATIQKVTDPLMSPTTALDCVLLLPHLGEVHLKASQSEQQWHLHLTFMRPAALDYAQKRQTTLTRRLSERLGNPVILALSSREENELDD